MTRIYSVFQNIITCQKEYRLHAVHKYQVYQRQLSPCDPHPAQPDCISRLGQGSISVLDEIHARRSAVQSRFSSFLSVNQGMSRITIQNTFTIDSLRDFQPLYFNRMCFTVAPAVSKSEEKRVMMWFYSFPSFLLESAGSFKRTFNTSARAKPEFYTLLILIYIP